MLQICPKCCLSPLCICKFVYLYFGYLWTWKCSLRCAEDAAYLCLHIFWPRIFCVGRKKEAMRGGEGLEIRESDGVGGSQWIIDHCQNNPSHHHSHLIIIMMVKTTLGGGATPPGPPDWGTQPLLPRSPFQLAVCNHNHDDCEWWLLWWSRWWWRRWWRLRWWRWRWQGSAPESAAPCEISHDERGLASHPLNTLSAIFNF